MNMRTVLISAIALALGPHLAALNATEKHPLAPEFSLADLRGQKVDLAAFRGHVVLLDFWATWCAPCRNEIPRFVELQKKYRDRGFQIIGVSLDDDAKAVRDFHAQFKMNYPVVIGNADLAERYGGILGLPVTFLIGSDGRIYSRHDGETDIAFIEQELELLLTRKHEHGSGARR